MTKVNLNSFLKTIRVLQWAVLVLPIGSVMLSTKTSLLGPPLGRLSLLVVPFGIALAGIGMVLPLLLTTLKAVRRVAWLSAATVVIGVLVYGYFVQRFVVTVDISSQGRSVLVSVGGDLSQPYRQLYAGQANSEIVKDQGYQEEDIDRVWTPSSLLESRLLGLCSYVFLLGSINTFMGALARLQTT
jgi:hypothetical protein